jgi:hypothetical protein
MRPVLIAVERAIPAAQRIALALVKATLASSLIVGAVIAGHELRGWRDWYPRVYHPWLDGPHPVEQVEP